MYPWIYVEIGNAFQSRKKTIEFLWAYRSQDKDVVRKEISKSSNQLCVNLYETAIFLLATT